MISNINYKMHSPNKSAFLIIEGIMDAFNNEILQDVSKYL